MTFRSRSFVPWVLSAATLAVPTTASAHGLFGHIHVTGYAIENLPAGDLRDLFDHPDVKDAALMGATFPDTGYPLSTAITAAYGEHAHWEPFIQGMIEHVRENYGPTYDTLEERKLVAFVMGMASHGLQDELFDSTCDLEVHQRDGEFDADTRIDGFFAYDGHARMYPTGAYVPYGDLMPVYLADGHDMLTVEIIQHQVDVVLGVYVNPGFGLDFALATGESYHAAHPFTYANYMNPELPGSFVAEITPNIAYLEAIWDRLHDRYPESRLVTHTWPDAPRRLRSHVHGDVASYVTVVFGIGVDYEDVRASLVDADGAPHPFVLSNTRWGTRMTRLVQFRATADYEPGARYVARLEPGIDRMDGRVTTEAHEIEFQVDCDPADPSRCPALGRIVDPVTDGSFEPSRGDASGCAVHADARASRASGAIVLATLVAGIARARRRRS